jgi:hypothetical protein
MQEIAGDKNPKVTDMINKVKQELEEKLFQIKREKDDLKH